MFRGQAQRRRDAGDRLVEAAAQSVLIASRRDRKPRRRADRRVRVAVREAQTLGRQSVEIRRTVRSAAVAVEVGVAEIVRQDENEIRSRRVALALHGVCPLRALGRRRLRPSKDAHSRMGTIRSVTPAHRSRADAGPDHSTHLRTRPEHWNTICRRLDSPASTLHCSGERAAMGGDP